MKTIEEIKNEVAVTYKYSSWENLIIELILNSFEYSRFQRIENEVATEYAKQCCEAQKEACCIALKDYPIRTQMLVHDTPNVVK